MQLTAFVRKILVKIARRRLGFPAQGRQQSLRSSQHVWRKLTLIWLWTQCLSSYKFSFQERIFIFPSTNWSRGLGSCKKREGENARLEPEEGLTLPNLHVHHLLIIFPVPIRQQQDSPSAEGSLCQQAQPQPRVLPGNSSGWELAPGSSICLGGMPSSPPGHGAQLPPCWHALSPSLPEKKHFKPQIPLQHTGVKVLELYVL